MKIDRVKLLEQLSLLKPAIKSGGLIPELSYIWFADQEVFAYDGTIGVRVPLDTGLECGVPGGVLLGLLGTSRLPEVSIDADDKGTCLVVKMGRSTSKLAMLDIERGVWPFPKDAAKGTVLNVTDDLLDALRHVLVVEPKHTTRVEHKGILIYRDKRGITLCATDSATIARARVDYKGAQVGDVVLLPRAFVEQMVRVCPAGGKLSICDDHLAARSDGLKLYSHVEDAAEVQDVVGIVDKLAKAHPEPVPVPAGLRIALERAEILEGAADAVVELSIVGGDLVSEGAYKFGELSERAKMKGGEHPDAFGQFEAGLVARGLAGAKLMSLDKSALVLHGAGDDLYAIAPRRVD